MASGDLTGSNFATSPDRGSVPLDRFRWNEDLRLFMHPSHEGFAYSDGVEVEQRIYDGLRVTQDRSTATVELRDLITDWPTEYHFSNVRHNLLRHIAFRANERVLEVGAGCGAITRLLGETGAQITAV